MPPGAAAGARTRGYVKRNCYVTLEADEVPGALRMALEELGEDHILMATDSPHFDSEYPHTVIKM